MGLKRSIANVLNSLTKPFGYEVLRSSLLYEWQRSSWRPCFNKLNLPEGAENYLLADHPKLKDLRQRYALFNKDVTTPLVWKDSRVAPDDIRSFRGDNAYLYQLTGQNMNVLGYALATYYVKSIDSLGLFEKSVEDDYFGAVTFLIDNKIVSRDLLDSITELYFLERHLRISASQDLNVLDIGAGYGRLAHRAISALPNMHAYFCTDAFAPSTFISEYYIGFRGLGNKAKVVPLDAIEKELETGRVDIAVNVHSFSECRLKAIDWWLTLLEKHRIHYVMIVPNAFDNGGELLLTSDRKDFRGIIEKHGYKLIASEPKYRDPVVQKYAINPTYHYLFELS